MPRYIKYFTPFGSALQGIPDSVLEASEVLGAILLATDSRSPLNQITKDPFQKAILSTAAYVYYDIYIVRSKPSPCTCS
jgi:hypothetical protein